MEFQLSYRAIEKKHNTNYDILTNIKWSFRHISRKVVEILSKLSCETGKCVPFLAVDRNYLRLKLFWYE